MTAKVAEEVAEELAQEKMISLWRKAESFERSRASAPRRHAYA